MIIKVTKQDIKNGLRSSPYTCPVALAVRRQVNFHEVSVTNCIKVGDLDWKNSKRFKYSRAVANFIMAFDNKRPVKPFNFRLNNVEVSR